MKKLLLTILLVGSLASMSAQELNFHKVETLGRPPYKKNDWSVEASLAIGQIPVNAIWQYNFNGWFKLGAGAGLSFPFATEIFSANIFARVGFIAARYKVRPYFTTDFGCLFTINNTDPDYMLFLAPNFGLAFVLRNQDKLSVGLGISFWVHQGYINSEPVWQECGTSTAMASVMPLIRLGYTF